MRPTFRDLAAWIACTGPTSAGTPNTIAPLADFLAKRELSPWLRRWLVSMLREDEGQDWYLSFARRRGRPNRQIDAPAPSSHDERLILLCKQTATIEPFATYLAEGGALSELLRDWLVAMLRGDTNESHQLHYVRRPGRPRKSMADLQKNAELEGMACELSEVTITEEFVKMIADIYDGCKMAAPEERDGKVILRLGSLKGAWYDPSEKFVEPDLTFVVGGKLNDSQIHFLLGVEFGVSISSVKRILRAYEVSRSIA